MTPPALKMVRSSENFAATPPHNMEAEQALLGALLSDNKVYYSVFEIVTAQDFYDPVHGRIYDAIAKTIDVGRVADSRTLRGQFESDEALKGIGGANYLVDLAASVITLYNIKDYARLIYELATRRRLIAYSNDVKSVALAQDAPPTSGETLISEAETRLFALAECRGQDGAISTADAFELTISKIELAYKHGRPMGLATGLASLDKILGGLQPGKLYTIGARPSMGKTALGLTIAANVAQTGAKVLLNTMEMEREEIVERLIARITQIPANRQQGGVNQSEFMTIFGTREELSSLPLHIDDTPGLKIGQIRGRAIRQKRRQGLDLLVIDYLGLIKRNEKIQNTNYQIEEITNGLKVLAKELHVPIILLAQLNRELEKRPDRRPTMADLRDSGSIEQDSDVVMFLYRHEYYITKEEPRRDGKMSDDVYEEKYSRWQAEVEKSRGKADLIVAKHRQGECGVVPLRFMGWRCMFSDLSDETTNKGEAA